MHFGFSTKKEKLTKTYDTISKETEQREEKKKKHRGNLITLEVENFFTLLSILHHYDSESF